MNDELVAKGFAYYDSEATDGSLDVSDQTPVMLSSDVLSRPIFTSNKSAAQAQEPSGKYRQDLTNAIFRHEGSTPQIPLL